jgi:dTDP-4-dehydrorhamnose reductase
VPTLLVTGASGYLGGALAARAATAGWAVTGTVHARPEAAPAGLARVATLDVRDAGAVAALVADVAPDAIVHTAYRQDGDAARAVNADGAGHVAAAARATGARLVHVSSDAIFRGAEERLLVEADVPDPVTAYGATKAAAEEAVRAACPEALLARTSLLYGGPGAPAGKHEDVALAAARGETDMVFFTDEVRSPVQVDDLAAALLELAAGRAAGALNVAGADAVSRLDFARLIVTARGHDAAALRGRPSPPDRPRFCGLDSTVAQACLRTRLRGVREVLGDQRDGAAGAPGPAGGHLRR